jgi:hypothetical protein
MARYRRLDPEVAEANLTDLDLAIFAKLPDEGTKLGFHPMMLSARQLLHELNAALPTNAPRLQMGELSGRLRALAQTGFVVPVSKSLSGRIDGWQRTARAARMVQS